MGKKLIPGYESYMEDNDIDVEVSVGDPAEVAESETEAVEATTDVESTDGDMQEEAQEAEMIFKRYDELDRMKAHLEKYGASREFMAWHNHDGALAEGLGITIPGEESLDATGDPYSTLSIACMEGIGDALRSIWEFIKKVCAKVARFFGRIVEAVTRAFSSLDSNIGRLRKALKEREPDTERLDKYEGSFVKWDELNQWKTKLETAMNKRVGPNEWKNVQGIVAKVIAAAGSAQDLSAFDDASLKNAIDSLDAEEKARRENKSDYKPESRPSKSTQKMPGDMATKADTILTTVSNQKQVIDRYKAKRAIIQAITSQMIGLANKMEKRDDPGADKAARTARKVSSIVNRKASIDTKFLSDMMWYCNQGVRIVSLYVANCTKKA